MRHDEQAREKTLGGCDVGGPAGSIDPSMLRGRQFTSTQGQGAIPRGLGRDDVDTKERLAPLRDRLVQAHHTAMSRGAQEDSRAARLQMVLDRLTPEQEEFLSLLSELLALGVSPFSI